MHFNLSADVSLLYPPLFVLVQYARRACCSLAASNICSICIEADNSTTVRAGSSTNHVFSPASGQILATRTIANETLHIPGYELDPRKARSGYEVVILTLLQKLRLLDD